MSDNQLTRIANLNNGYFVLAIDGYMIPFIKARQNEDKSWTLLLDDRFAVDITDENELNKWIWWIADAMAISAGWTAFGKDGKRSNPFQTRIFGLSEINGELFSDPDVEMRENGENIE